MKPAEVTGLVLTGGVGAALLNWIRGLRKDRAEVRHEDASTADVLTSVAQRLVTQMQQDNDRLRLEIEALRAELRTLTLEFHAYRMAHPPRPANARTRSTDPGDLTE